jgi:hypothetical protein
MASEEGEFTIPPISIQVGGEIQTTQPIPFRVVSQGTAGQSAGLPEIFLRIELDDETPVVGQQLVAAITLYFRDGTEISSYQPLQGWRADGFWREELENSSQPRAESVLLQNQRYRKAILLRFALFPTRSGELTLAPYGMMLGVRNRSANRDPFGSIFDSFGTNQRRITVESEPVTLTVNPLPSTTSGLMSDAVGDFKVSRSISENQIVRGEGFEVVTTFEGTGNLPLISRVEFNYPDSFEEYTPQENTELNRVGTQISGRKIFTELLVAQQGGNFVIPAEQLAIYNPKLNRWQNISLPALTLEVREPIVSSWTPPVGQTGIPALMEGQPEGYIYYSIPSFVFSKGRAIYLIYAPLLILIIAISLKLRQQYLQKNSGVILRNSAARRAFKEVKELQTRHQNLGAISDESPAQIKDVYRDLLQILTTYYVDRTEQPGRAMATSEILKELNLRASKRMVSIHEVDDLLSKLGRISYSPEVSSVDLNNDLERALSVISIMEEILE